MANFDTNITATYSPEDNKIRLYASKRLDAETYERVKAAGFKWAPRQELFVAPKWSVTREDFAVELAGQIEAEEMTMAERAQIKAERLEGIADKRAEQATGYARAASAISERFASGQPILVGHHSERKARKDAERMETASRKASEAHKAIGYWLYRATGVEHHANRKNDPKVRARRIKTLLAELRDLQRRLNSAYRALATWEKFTTDKDIIGFLNYSELCHSPGFNLWHSVDKGEVTPQDARQQCIDSAQGVIDNPRLSRWINHTLNRLSYERDMLGDVPRYTGEITPATLQMFVREHGAEKPKGSKVEDDLFTVECKAPLPAHVGDGDSLELSGDEWRDLMQSCGYVPLAKKAAKPPILNFSSNTGFLTVKSRAIYRGADPVEVLPVVAVTKAEYSAIPTDYKGTRYSPCGEFRVRFGRNPKARDQSYRAG